MAILSRHLKLGGSAIALVAVTSLAPALAQPANAPEAVEEVTVTGTNIRGVAPVGANLITMGPQNLQATGGQTLDEMLKKMPALSSAGQVGQGIHNSTYFSPNIHQLGGSSSSSTLVVLDGMRLPLGGTVHSQPDPSIVPAIAVQRVDVLADGASAVYGSDAVAGVVNIITRDSYDGLTINASAGYANNYNKWNGNLLWGTVWDNGNAMIAYQHSYLSSIDNSTRQPKSFDFRPFGGTNQNSYSCIPASLQPNGTGNIYLPPDYTTSVPGIPANAPCNVISGNYLPKEVRDNALAKMTQRFGKFTLSATMLYAVRTDTSFNDAGSITGTVFGPGFANTDQINPFYQNPPGVAATKQTVRYNLQGLLPRSRIIDGANDIYAHVRGSYQLGSDWTVNADVVAGQDDSQGWTYNGFCSQCAYLALNGTANTTGDTTKPAIVGTNLIPLNVPLTTANALDVWNPAATNKTSAATRALLGSYDHGSTATNAFLQYRLSADGTLFQGPAGPIKLAVGAEVYLNSLVQNVTESNGLGPAVYGSGFEDFHYSRVVQSVYAEANVPLISPDMGLPLAQAVTINISGRYDKYTDLGSTANPKIAMDWTMMNGLKLRGSYSTSFVAPQLDSIGDPDKGYRASYASAGGTSGHVVFPTSLYPAAAGVLPGCAANAVTCEVGGGTGLDGLQEIRGIGPNAQPEHGNGYTVGVDLAPDFLPGFTANITLFNASFKGAVTSANVNVYANVASLNKYFTVCPTGCSAALVNSYTAPFPTLSSPLPSTVYYIYSHDQANIENLTAQGLDMSVNYDFDTNFGHFHIGEFATDFLKYTISFGYPVSGPTYSLLNTTGQTSQFPEIKWHSRTNLGWSMGGLAVDLFMNYTGSYHDWDAPATPILHDAYGNPTGGGDVVGSYTTFDLHASYDIPDGFLAGNQIYIDGSNIFDAHPPFYNSHGQFETTGTNDLVTNLVGRLMSVGIRATF
jgi:iron complex outermembrane receptor protein